MSTMPRSQLFWACLCVSITATLAVHHALFNEASVYEVVAGVPVRVLYARDSARQPHIDEVVRLHINSVGKRSQRADSSAPLVGTAHVGREEIQWQLPWHIRRDGLGPHFEHLQLLSCTAENDAESLVLSAVTTSTRQLHVQLKVATENVALASRTRMRSTVADVSYRRYRWPRSVAELEIELVSVKGAEVCASLLVMDACVTQPYLFDRPRQTFNFTDRLAVKVVRERFTGDSVWIYLLPQWNPDFCAETLGRAVDGAPPAKTVAVTVNQRSFSTGGEPNSAGLIRMDTTEDTRSHPLRPSLISSAVHVNDSWSSYIGKSRL